MLTLKALKEMAPHTIIAHGTMEDTPLGLIIRGEAPEPFESHSHIGNFIHDVTEMVSDPLMLASAFATPEGVGVGGFAADAALETERGFTTLFQSLEARRLQYSAIPIFQYSTGHAIRMADARRL